jgi:hypothetical protein
MMAHRTLMSRNARSVSKVSLKYQQRLNAFFENKTLATLASAHQGPMVSITPKTVYPNNLIAFPTTYRPYSINTNSLDASQRPVASAHPKSLDSNNLVAYRRFSTAINPQDAVDEKAPGRVTRTLRVLDMDVVKKIIEELRSVDVNSDGRYEK